MPNFRSGDSEGFEHYDDDDYDDEDDSDESEYDNDDGGNSTMCPDTVLVTNDWIDYCSSRNLSSTDEAATPGVTKPTKPEFSLRKATGSGSDLGLRFIVVDLYCHYLQKGSSEGSKVCIVKNGSFSSGKLKTSLASLAEATKVFADN